MKLTDQQLLEHFNVHGVGASLVLAAGGLEPYWRDCRDGVLLLTLAINLRLFTAAQRRDLACWAIRNLPYDESGCMTFAETIEGSMPHEVLAVAEAHAQGVATDADLASAARGLGTYVFKSREGDYDRAQISYAVSCAATVELTNHVSDRTALCALLLVQPQVSERSRLFADELRRRLPVAALRREVERAKGSQPPIEPLAGEELL